VPTAAEIGQAFVVNILNRTTAADVDLNPEEEENVRGGSALERRDASHRV